MIEDKISKEIEKENSLRVKDFIKKLFDNTPVSLESTEILIESERDKLNNLQKLKEKGELNLEEKIKYTELPTILEDVKEKVDYFLDVENVETPKIRGYNNVARTVISLSSFPLAMASTLYIVNSTEIENIIISCIFGASVGISAGIISKKIEGKFQIQTTSYTKNKLIKITSKQKYKVIPGIAHEYAHHVQVQKGKFFNYSILSEGHARGVERYISELFAKETGDHTYLLDITDRTYGELKSYYIDQCQFRKVEPKQDLIKLKSTRDKEEFFNRKKKGKPTIHSLGNCVFLLYEVLHGRDIYREALKI